LCELLHIFSAEAGLFVVHAPGWRCDLQKGILTMFNKLTIAFAVVIGLTSGAFAAPKWHAKAHAWGAYAYAPAWNAYLNTPAWNAYASAGPVYRSPEFDGHTFGRTWDPYGVRWE
jgi:hypothetical protein